MPHRLFVAYLILLLAAILQLQIKTAGNGAAPDFILAAVFTFAFVLSIAELLPVLLTAVWLLNWQPVINQELLYLLFLALAIFLLKRLVPWQPWLSGAVCVLSGVLVFYLLSGVRPWEVAGSAFLSIDVVLVLLFTWLTLALLRISGRRTALQNLF